MPRNRLSSNPEPPSKPVVKSAYITGIFTVIAALIVGIFHLLGTQQPHKQGDAVPSLPYRAEESAEDQGRMELRPESEPRNSTSPEFILPSVDDSPYSPKARTEPTEPHSKSSPDDQSFPKPTDTEKSIDKPLAKKVLLRHGEAIQLKERLVISATFRQTLGTQHLDLIIVGGEDTKKIPALAPGGNTSLTVDGNPYNLSIVSIDWDAQATNVFIQEK